MFKIFNQSKLIFKNRSSSFPTNSRFFASKAKAKFRINKKNHVNSDSKNDKPQDGDSDLAKTMKSPFFVDKTNWIEKIKQDFTENSAIISLRPRRFGKSIFLEMLDHFYNERLKKDYTKLFKGTKIAKIFPNGSPKRRPVLRFSFAGLNIDSPGEYLHDFRKVIYEGFLEFHKLYPNLKIIDDPKFEEFTVVQAMRRVQSNLNVANQKILVLIDEYDSILNATLNQEPFIAQQYKKCSPESAINQFFTNLKEWCQKGHLLFVTGVAPIALDLTTSGFDIGYFLHKEEGYEEMYGFSEEDVTKLTQKLKISEEDKILLNQEFKTFHSGYFFSNTQEGTGLYNPYRLTRNLKSIKNSKSKNWKNIVHNSDGTGSIINLFKTVDSSPSDATLHLLSSFPSATVKVPNWMEKFSTLLVGDQLAEDDQDVRHRLMFYLGALTFKKGSNVEMRIPNELARKEFIVALQSRLNAAVGADRIAKIRGAIRSVVKNHDVAPFCNRLTEILPTIVKYGALLQTNERVSLNLNLFFRILGVLDSTVDTETPFYLPKKEASSDKLLLSGEPDYEKLLESQKPKVFTDIILDVQGAIFVLSINIDTIKGNVGYSSVCVDDVQTATTTNTFQGKTVDELKKFKVTRLEDVLDESGKPVKDENGKKKTKFVERTVGEDMEKCNQELKEKYSPLAQNIAELQGKNLVCFSIYCVGFQRILYSKVDLETKWISFN